MARDVLALGKPRLTLLVVCTAGTGMWLAPGRRDTGATIAFLVGSALVIGAANTLNNLLEIDVDRLMRRTRDRPLPSGRLRPWVAKAIGVAGPATGLPLLAASTNWLTTALAALALFTYVAVYTPLKRRTSSALFVGAVPGAVPPLMGWTAASGSLDAGGIALFALLFCWQVPHFLAIATYLQDDYARAGLRAFPLAHGERATRLWAGATSSALLPISLALVPLGVAGPWYGVAATMLGASLAGYALAGCPRRGVIRWARNLFLLTLAYLTLLLGTLLLAPR